MKPWTVEQSTPRYRMNGARVVSRDERLERMRFYHLGYAPSGSDGAFYAEMLIAVDCFEYAICPEAWVRQAVLVIGGHPMVFTMGVCPGPGWTLRKISLADWEGRETGRRSRVDGSAEAHEALFLSDGPPIEGWPAPARLEDIQFGSVLATKIDHWRGYGCSEDAPL